MISKLQPTPASRLLRARVFEYLSKLIQKANPRAMPFTFGSVASSVYLPDGDIDIGVCVHPSGVNDFFSKLTKLLYSESGLIAGQTPAQILSQVERFKREAEIVANAAEKASHAAEAAKSAASKAQKTLEEALSMLPNQLTPEVQERLREKVLEAKLAATAAANAAASASSDVAAIADPILSGGDSACAQTMPISQIRLVESAGVPLVKCATGGVPADISANTLAGLGAVCLFEEVDAYLGRNHLFKRTVLLCKAWADYEAKILASANFLLSSYALEVLVLYVINIHCADALRLEDAYNAHVAKCPCARFRQSTLATEGDALFWRQCGAHDYHAAEHKESLRRHTRRRRKRQFSTYSQGLASPDRRVGNESKRASTQSTGTKGPMEFFRSLAAKTRRSGTRPWECDISVQSYFPTNPFSTLERIEFWVTARSRHRAAQARLSAAQLKSHVEQVKKKLALKQETMQSQEASPRHTGSGSSLVLSTSNSTGQVTDHPAGQSGNPTRTCMTAAATVSLSVLADGLESFGLRNGTGGCASSTHVLNAYDEETRGVSTELLDLFEESVDTYSAGPGSSRPEPGHLGQESAGSCDQERSLNSCSMTDTETYHSSLAEEDDEDEWDGRDLIYSIGSDGDRSDADIVSAGTDTGSESRERGHADLADEAKDADHGAASDDETCRYSSRRCRERMNVLHQGTTLTGSDAAESTSLSEARRRMRRRIPKRRMTNGQENSNEANGEPDEASPEMRSSALLDSLHEQDTEANVNVGGDDTPDEGANYGDNEGTVDDDELQPSMGVSKSRSRKNRRRRRKGSVRDEDNAMVGETQSACGSVGNDGTEGSSPHRGVSQRPDESGDEARCQMQADQPISGDYESTFEGELNADQRQRKRRKPRKKRRKKKQGDPLNQGAYDEDAGASEADGNPDGDFEGDGDDGNESDKEQDHSLARRPTSGIEGSDDEDNVNMLGDDMQQDDLEIKDSDIEADLYDDLNDLAEPDECDEQTAEAQANFQKRRAERRLRIEMERRAALRAKLNRKHRKRLAIAKLRRSQSFTDSVPPQKPESDGDADVDGEGEMPDAPGDNIQSVEVVDALVQRANQHRRLSRGSSRSSRRQARRRRNALARRTALVNRLLHDTSAAALGISLSRQLRKFAAAAKHRGHCCPCVYRPAPPPVTPFYIFCTFVSVLASFDWSNFAVSIGGPVPIEALRLMQEKMLTPHSWQQRVPASDQSHQSQGNTDSLARRDQTCDPLQLDVAMWGVPEEKKANFSKHFLSAVSEFHKLESLEPSSSGLDGSSIGLADRRRGGRGGQKHQSVPLLELDHTNPVEGQGAYNDLAEPNSSIVPFLPHLRAAERHCGTEPAESEFAAAFDAAERSAYRRELRCAFPSASFHEIQTNTSEQSASASSSVDSAQDSESDFEDTKSIVEDVSPEGKDAPDSSQGSASAVPVAASSSSAATTTTSTPSAPLRGQSSSEWAWFTVSYPTKYAPPGTHPYLPFEFLQRCSTLYGFAALTPGVPLPPRSTPEPTRSTILRYSTVLSATAQASALSLYANSNAAQMGVSGTCAFPSFRQPVPPRSLLSSEFMKLAELTKATASSAQTTSVILDILNKIPDSTDHSEGLRFGDNSAFQPPILRSTLATEAAAAAAQEALALWTDTNESNPLLRLANLPELHVPYKGDKKDDHAEDKSSSLTCLSQTCNSEEIRKLVINRAIHASLIARYLYPSERDASTLAMPVNIDHVFAVRAMNIIDPLDWSNNLGRSVSIASAYRIRSAFAKAAQSIHGVMSVSDRFIAPARSLPSPSALVQSALAQASSPSNPTQKQLLNHTQSNRSPFIPSQSASAGPFSKALILSLASVSHTQPGSTRPESVPSSVVDSLSVALDEILKYLVAAFEGMLQPLTSQALTQALTFDCDRGTTASKQPKELSEKRVDQGPEANGEGVESEGENKKFLARQSELDSVRQPKSDPEKRLVSPQSTHFIFLYRTASEAVVSFILPILRHTYTPRLPFLRPLFPGLIQELLPAQSTSSHATNQTVARITNTIQSARLAAIRAAAAVCRSEDPEPKVNVDCMNAAKAAAKAAVRKVLEAAELLPPSDLQSDEGDTMKERVSPISSSQEYPLLALLTSLATAALVAVYFEKLRHAIRKIASVAAATVANIALSTPPPPYPNSPPVALVTSLQNEVSTSHSGQIPPIPPLGTLGLGQRIMNTSTIGPLSVGSLQSATPLPQFFAAPLGALGAACLFLTCPKYIDRCFRLLRWALVTCTSVTISMVAAGKEPIESESAAYASILARRLVTSLLVDTSTLAKEVKALSELQGHRERQAEAFKGNLRDYQWQLAMFRHLAYLNSSIRTNAASMTAKGKGATEKASAAEAADSATLPGILSLSQHRPAAFNTLMVAHPFTDSSTLQRIAMTYAMANKLPSFHPSTLTGVAEAITTSNDQANSTTGSGDLDPTIALFYGGRKPDLSDPVPSALGIHSGMTHRSSSQDREARAENESSRSRSLVDETAAALLAPPTVNAAAEGAPLPQGTSNPWSNRAVSYAERLRSANFKAIAIAAAVAHSRQQQQQQPQQQPQQQSGQVQPSQLPGQMSALQPPIQNQTQRTLQPGGSRTNSPTPSKTFSSVASLPPLAVRPSQPERRSPPASPVPNSPRAAIHNVTNTPGRDTMGRARIASLQTNTPRRDSTSTPTRNASSSRPRESLERRGSSTFPSSSSTSGE